MRKVVIITKDRIKLIRKELDLTQQEFAQKIGTSQNVLANYEIGRRNPSNSVINNICKTFNVNEEWLRTGNGEMFVEIDIDDELMRWAGSVLSGSDESFQKRFLNLLRRLDEKDWATLEKIAVMLYEGEQK